MLSDSYLASPHVRGIDHLTGNFLIFVLRLLRAWALWDRRRDVGFFFIALCCGTYWSPSLPVITGNIVM